MIQIILFSIIFIKLSVKLKVHLICTLHIMLKDIRLKCIVLDDDPEVHETIKGFLHNSGKAEVTHCFLSCADFLEHIYRFSFDQVFIDCFFPGDTIHGIDVAIKLKELGKYFIFISAIDKLFIEACREVGALDAIPKPLSEKRMLEAIDYTYKIIFPREIESREHILVHVKELKGETSIAIHNILYAKPNPDNSKNKIVRLKKGISYTFMNWNFHELLDLSPDFGMANRFELVSYDIVENVGRDYITLNQLENNHIPHHIPLGNLYKDSFKREFH